MEVSVYKILEDSAQKFPQHPAVCDEYGCLTYAQLYQEAEQLRTQLSKAGLTPSMGIGLVAKNSREFVIGLFATLGCGATVMPLSHQLKQEELSALLKEAPLHYILDDGSGISPSGIHSQRISCGSKTFCLTLLDDNSKAFVPHVRNAACVRFTSGTTGKSKGVILSHQSILERTEAAQNALQLSQDDTVVWSLPMAYHFVVSITMYIRYGVTIAICSDDLPQTIIQTARKYKGTFLYASPSHYRTLSEDSSGLTMPELKRAISTSSGIPSHIARKFYKRFNTYISQVYGIIEVGLPAGNLDEPEVSATSIGRALPSFSVGIFNDSMEEVPTGTIGQLAFKGPGMFDAYLSPPQQREEVLKNGWFLTGDLAFKNESGLIVVAGRRKSLINVAGHKVFPEEVEAVINTHDAISLSRVYRKEDPEMGEIVAAELVLKNGKVPSKEELYNYFQEKLSSHKVPQEIDYVSKISMTKTGKILR